MPKLSQHILTLMTSPSALTPFLQLWIQRQHNPPKHHCQSTTLHHVNTQTTIIFNHYFCATNMYQTHNANQQQALTMKMPVQAFVCARACKHTILNVNQMFLCCIYLVNCTEMNHSSTAQQLHTSFRMKADVQHNLQNWHSCNECILHIHTFLLDLPSNLIIDDKSYRQV